MTLDALTECQGVLDTIGTAVSKLLADAPQTPSTLRVRVGDVEIEVGWPQQATVLPVAPLPAPVEVASAPVSGGTTVRAETVGVFYRAPEPGASPFVEVGDSVVAGQQIAIVEAMKMMIPVTSPVSGRIDQVLADNGTAVEFDQPLLVLA